MRRQSVLFPHPSFPLSKHRNGQWCKHVWNRQKSRSETFYFGAVGDDPQGKRALYDPAIGYFARMPAIETGTDRVMRINAHDGENMTLGDLTKRYLQEVKNRVDAGELSLRTFDTYLRELRKYADFVGVGTIVQHLRPEHFSSYMKHLTQVRKLGNCARRRVRTDISAMLKYGATNGWFPVVPTGSAWKSPPVDKAALRIARMRAGKPDYSDRLVTGDELDKLLSRATPPFKAILLLMINAALGPADIGRLRWRHLDLEARRLAFPRPKTGVERKCYLWKKTCDALLALRTIKRFKAAIVAKGPDAEVFISKRGNAMYRESLRTKVVEVNSKTVTKTVGVKVENAVSITVSRLIRLCELAPGLRPYSLRHSAKTYAKASQDRDAINLMMGHQDRSVQAIYDHEEISWTRLRRVALAIKRKLWPTVNQANTKPKLRPLPPGASQPGARSSTAIELV